MKGHIVADSAEIAGFKINTKDLTISDNTNNVLGFISKGQQDGWYSVGTSGNKQNWFIWNKGTATATGVGTFGVDMNGMLYTTKLNATGGMIGDSISGNTYFVYIVV
jgi:hypothetical protein